MRRPAIRFLLTLAIATSILGVVPATSEAGIIPWAWDTVFGPVGSIQARRAARYCGSDCGVSAGCCYGPAPGLFGGFRGRFRNGNCCGTNGYASYGAYGYGAYGYGGDCSSCGIGGCSTGGCGAGGCGIGGCNTGCSSCGVGYSGYDGGYVYGGGCGPGGCASGQCNVNYPPANAPGAAPNQAPVTPAAPPTSGAGGPTPYDNTAGPSPANNNVIPPAAPPTSGEDGFVPRPGAVKSPAPVTADPNQEYVPPKVNPEGAAAPIDANGNATETPAVPKKKPSFGEDDEKGGALGPRLELQEKITWRQSVVRVRMAQTPVRVTATAQRHGMFPKVAWRHGTDTELAKK